MAKIHEYHPIGILLGHHETITEDGTGVLTEQNREASSRSKPERILTNTGIGVVAPIDPVFDLVDRPDVIAAMKAAILKKKP